jgi:hypothetical protein
MKYIKIKTLEKITAGLVVFNIALLVVLSYNYYLA